MANEETTAKTKRTTTTSRKRAAAHTSRRAGIREVEEEELEIEEPSGRKTVHRKYSWDLGIPTGLSQAWDHVVSAETEYLLAFLSVFGLDEEKINEMAKRRRTRPEKSREEERIEVREVHVNS